MYEKKSRATERFIKKFNGLEACHANLFIFAPSVTLKTEINLILN